MNNKQQNFLLYLSGLRGLAILLVLCFHIFPSSFSQGYLGVDIFLVISGYLLFRSYDDKNFSLLSFTSKKIVRIYPVLSCTILATGIMLMFVMYAHADVKTYTKTVIYSLFGLANYFFDKEYTNYFSESANLNPLLHLWYLSVIIQVYLLWGIGCWFISILCKINQKYTYTIRKTAILFIILISCLSYCYSQSFTFHEVFSSIGLPVWPQTQDVAYWNTFGRIWQVLAGGLVFVLPPVRNNRVCTMLTVMSMVILLSLSLCNIPAIPFASTFVVICTVLSIRYLPDVKFRAFLEQKWLTWLGGISFSLYLVHFPILVLYKRWEKSYPQLAMSITLIAIALVLAYLLWRYVERKRISVIKTIFWVMIACLGTCACRIYVSRYVWLQLHDTIIYPTYTREIENVAPSIYNGFVRHELLKEGGTMHYLRKKASDAPILPLGTPSDHPQFVLLGDSNAQHWYAGFNELCLKHHISGVHLDSIVLPMMDRYIQIGQKNYKWDKNKAAALFDWLDRQKSIDTVVISFLWHRLHAGPQTDWRGRCFEATFAENAKKLKDFCQKIKSQGKKVVLLMPSPILLDLNRELHGKVEDYAQWMIFRGKQFPTNSENHPLVLSKTAYDNYYKDVIQLLNTWEEHGDCKILHIEREMFKHDYFHAIRNNVMYGVDRYHISPAAAVEIMETVGHDFVDILRKNAANSHH